MFHPAARLQRNRGHLPCTSEPAHAGAMEATGVGRDAGHAAAVPANSVRYLKLLCGHIQHVEPATVRLPLTNKTTNMIGSHVHL